MASELVKNVGAADFEAEVVNATVPVVVDFWAEWCGPCKMLGPMLDEIAKEQEGKLKIVKVNVDNEPALAQKFGIRAIPSLLYFKGGQMKDQSVGVASKKDLLKKVEALG